MKLVYSATITIVHIQAFNFREHHRCASLQTVGDGTTTYSQWPSCKGGGGDPGKPPQMKPCVASMYTSCDPLFTIMQQVDDPTRTGAAGKDCNAEHQRP